MRELTMMFGELGPVAYVILAWIVLGLAVCAIMTVYYIAMEYRKSTSALFPGGAVPCILGVALGVVILLAMPPLLELAARLAAGSPSIIFSAAPEHRAALLARIVAVRLNAAAFTLLGQLILAVPTAIFVGLALTVPFRRRRRIEAARMGGAS